jgi:hypothetical protein
MWHKKDETGGIALNTQKKKKYSFAFAGIKEHYAHIAAYSVIHTLVAFQPFFHVKISSTRSCNQNTGPTRATKRRKLVVVIGIERGSREESKEVVPLRGLGVGAEVKAGERRSCGRFKPR